MSRIQRILAGSALLLTAFPALAQDADTDTGSTGMKFLGAGLAIGLGIIGGGMGQGRAAAAALEGIGRNPQSRKEVFVPFILAMALIEFQAIMAFIMAILIWNA